MDEQEYLKSRLDDQVAWYDKKSQAAKRSYQRLRTFEIVAAAIIPFLAAYASRYVAVQVVLGVVGVALAVAGGLLSLHRHQEQWVGYRTAGETLLHERFLFQTRAAPYDGEQPFQLLVQRAEAAMSTENTAWVQASRTDRPKPGAG